MSTCSSCNGAGSFVCDNCNGSGTIGSGPDQEKCNGCNGTGSIRCANCNGTGEEPEVNRGWRSLMPGCVGSADGILGHHSLDGNRTRRMMADAILAGATMDDIENALGEFMEGKGMSAEHISTQIDRLRRLRF